MRLISSWSSQQREQGYDIVLRRQFGLPGTVRDLAAGEAWANRHVELTEEKGHERRVAMIDDPMTPQAHVHRRDHD